MIARSHYLLYKAITPSVCFSVCMDAHFWCHVKNSPLYTRLNHSWNVDETPNPSLCTCVALWWMPGLQVAWGSNHHWALIFSVF